jgi:hypothetical protein
MEHNKERFLCESKWVFGLVPPALFDVYLVRCHEGYVAEFCGWFSLCRVVLHLWCVRTDILVALRGLLLVSFSFDFFKSVSFIRSVCDV